MVQHFKNEVLSLEVLVEYRLGLVIVIRLLLKLFQVCLENQQFCLIDSTRHFFFTDATILFPDRRDEGLVVFWRVHLKCMLFLPYLVLDAALEERVTIPLQVEPEGFNLILDCLSYADLAFGSVRRRDQPLLPVDVMKQLDEFPGVDVQQKYRG